MEVKLVRTLRLGCIGSDVFASKRIVAKGLRDGPVKAGQPARTFGPFFKTRVNTLRGKLGMKRTGEFDQKMLDRCVDEGLVDGYSVWLLNEYAKAHPPKPVVKLIEPNQGWRSLRKDLWEPFSIGRSMGLTDLGTWNPASRLPGSGAPSDHAVYPACAFDLGISPANGYANPVGRRYFDLMMKHPAVAYVILGDRIYSKRRASEGVRRYTAGGHANHVHISAER